MTVLEVEKMICPACEITRNDDEAKCSLCGEKLISSWQLEEDIASIKTKIKNFKTNILDKSHQQEIGKIKRKIFAPTIIFYALGSILSLYFLFRCIIFIPVENIPWLLILSQFLFISSRFIIPRYKKLLKKSKEIYTVLLGLFIIGTAGITFVVMLHYLANLIFNDNTASYLYYYLILIPLLFAIFSTFSLFFLFIYRDEFADTRALRMSSPKDTLDNFFEALFEKAPHRVYDWVAPDIDLPSCTQDEVSAHANRYYKVFANYWDKTLDRFSESICYTTEENNRTIIEENFALIEISLRKTEEKKKEKIQSLFIHLFLSSFFIGDIIEIMQSVMEINNKTENNEDDYNDDEYRRGKMKLLVRANGLWYIMEPKFSGTLDKMSPLAIRKALNNYNSDDWLDID